jgi:hypothetical protein
MYSCHNMIRILVVLEVNSFITEAKQSTYHVESWEVGSQKLTLWDLQKCIKKVLGFSKYIHYENNKFKKISGISSIILDRSTIVYGL